MLSGSDHRSIGCRYNYVRRVMRADILKQYGIMDPACETLAELCSKSVDFSKNGGGGHLLGVCGLLSALVSSRGPLTQVSQAVDAL
jgi:hypothetical protein